jgi:hypothetical protein
MFHEQSTTKQRIEYYGRRWLGWVGLIAALASGGNTAFAANIDCFAFNFDGTGADAGAIFNACYATSGGLSYYAKVLPTGGGITVSAVLRTTISPLTAEALPLGGSSSRNATFMGNTAPTFTDCTSASKDNATNNGGNGYYCIYYNTRENSSALNSSAFIVQRLAGALVPTPPVIIASISNKPLLYAMYCFMIFATFLGFSRGSFKKNGV